LFIVDNSDTDWKVQRYVREWCDLASRIDVATGYFEIGALLALDGQWQKLDQLRILMGDEVSKRTKQALAAGIKAGLEKLDQSIEEQKKTDDFLSGADAVVDGLRSGKINCRVYAKEKFHAKAYINHARSAVIGSAALVGSSNFTYPGLTDNVELNVQIKGREVEVLQQWYDHYWEKAQDITESVLKVVERHTREYPPFDVYAKALEEYFKGRELDADAWESADNGKGSRLFSELSGYQCDGYKNLLKIADQFGGAFLCDGVGLGKTFVGLMLLERLIIKEGMNVLLLVPKAGIESVWMPAIRRYLPHLSGKFANLAVLSHTDLTLKKCQDDVRSVKERAHAIIVDEAHHFRNPGAIGWAGVTVGGAGDGTGGKFAPSAETTPSRYRVLSNMAEGKRLFMLTATPVNNKLSDLRHMIELFSRKQEDYFKETLGINSLRAHFNQLEKRLEKSMGETPAAGEVQTNTEQAKEVLAHDTLFKRLVVQRSRSYVRKSQEIAGVPATLFPKREHPKVAAYSVKKTYGDLLSKVDQAFKKDKPLFTLAIYFPLAYYCGPDASIDKVAENRQQQVVALVRTSFLKRFESSVVSFERSCERLLVRLMAWVTVHAEGAEKRALETWMRREADVIGYVESHQHELWGDPENDEPEDLIDPELVEEIEERKLSRADYNVADMITETMQDLETLIGFLKELKKFKPKDDGKVAALLKMLRTEPVLKAHKVLIFTEFADTARYLKQQLTDAGVDGLAVVDGSTDGRTRAAIIRRFAPYYNGTSSAGLKKDGQDEIRVLISTDVLSEGLNLQDATRLINFDLHWNPVRLMQRIGRVDRRMNKDIEDDMVRDHPDRKPLRGTVAYWNFLPPDELNTLLTLYSRVTHKTLRISKTMGIEGKKLLKEDDDFEDLKEFNEAYDGIKTQSPMEKLRLEFEEMLAKDPKLAERLAALPGRVFSGMEHHPHAATGVFFCYALPGKATAAGGVAPGLWGHAAPPPKEADGWTLDAGEVRWYFTPGPDGPVVEEPTQIAPMIRATPETPRRCALTTDQLAETRKAVEKHITNTYFRQRQAPVGIKPVLRCWMELS
jgi:superfamily II DNA or RNA helicase